MAEPLHHPQSTTLEDRRRFRRIATRVEGRIVFAGVDAECLIHEMSATGAVVEVAPLPALGAEIALDVPGVGFARGRATRYPADGLVGIDLAVPEDRQDKLTDRLILAAFRNPPLHDPADE
ncbi:hypothetical protein Plav_2617 [Parvibaculum lavamentivorans DS-1]|uniref:PilZ domain-containing protein n=1 Tax=Parvibaculum lavamentivorans (strain DS-1 / DSM 13023 / NCIMB 13966) TaxID=402881 RepID=A7HWE2_PARL1|nr:PilZ domain-containing protein [Parvibaculum lavamentivorans]ABS64225.1 hypothetical protein Plav_2617 [Parvibaculum lavamentivorans DS-1]